MNLVCKNWFRIVNSDKKSLLYDSYLCNIEMSHKNLSTWVNSVKGILYEVGLQELWNNQGNMSGVFPSSIFKKEIYSKFRQQWENDISSYDNDESKLRTYVKFKKELNFECYLDVIKHFETRRNLTRLRISAHNLCIETGRHRRPCKVPLDQRKCNTCDIIEDEFHFMMICDQFKEPRNVLFHKLKDLFGDLENYNNNQLFIVLMELKDFEVIKLVEKYMLSCLDIREKLL